MTRGEGWQRRRGTNRHSSVRGRLMIIHVYGLDYMVKCEKKTQRDKDQKPISPRLVWSHHTLYRKWIFTNQLVNGNYYIALCGREVRAMEKNQTSKQANKQVTLWRFLEHLSCDVCKKRSKNFQLRATRKNPQNNRLSFRTKKKEREK